MSGNRMFERDESHWRSGLQPCACEVFYVLDTGDRIFTVVRPNMSVSLIKKNRLSGIYIIIMTIFKNEKLILTAQYRQFGLSLNSNYVLWNYMMKYIPWDLFYEEILRGNCNQKVPFAAHQEPWTSEQGSPGYGTVLARCAQGRVGRGVCEPRCRASVMLWTVIRLVPSHTRFMSNHRDLRPMDQTGPSTWSYKCTLLEHSLPRLQPILSSTGPVESRLDGPWSLKYLLLAFYGESWAPAIQ